MEPLELAELLAASTEHPVREALRELAPRRGIGRPAEVLQNQLRSAAQARC
ncbi:hypothetical protein [Streptomyces sp. NBC_00687]|uniref:hypothetical protein n=1 Tax=Streptomyces sp. NBC_00687 TaxID=2975807 RepID=UPI0022534E9E|nr:hypothetical protein [Streptomyces sp. NBC_00687]MCX4919880.1 hypothetical protein [Streptomyces sp. NBC_00687]